MKLFSALSPFAIRMKAVLALTVLVGASAVLVPATSARAVWIIAGFALGEEQDDEAYVIRWMDPETGVSYVEAVYKDGSKAFWPDNPNPEDGTTSPGDWGMMADLLKQQGGTGYLTPSWQNTPLGAELGDKGPGPYYNPSDDDNGGGGQSPSNIDFFDPRKLAEEVMNGGGVGGGLNIDGNGGSVGGQLSDYIRRGNKGNGDDDGDGAKPSDGGFWGDDLPGPPELVNPAWTTEDWELFMLMETEFAEQRR